MKEHHIKQIKEYTVG